MTFILCPWNYPDDGRSAAGWESVSGFAAGTPAANMNSNKRGLIARTTSSAVTTATARTNWGGTDITVDTLYLHNHNIPATGVIRLTGYTDTGYSTGSTVVSLTVPADGGRGDTLRSSLLRFTSMTKKSVVLDLVQQTQAVQMQAERTFVGKSWTPSIGAEYGATMSWKDGTTFKRTIGGSIQLQNGARWREITVEFNYLPEAERATLVGYLKKAGKSRTFLVSLYADGSGYQESDHTMIAVLSEDHMSVANRWSYWGDRLVFTEI